MQIIHRISIATSPDIQRELARLGISVADGGFVSFDVDESNKSWPELEEWVARRLAVDVARTLTWLGVARPDEVGPPGEGVHRLRP